MLVDSKQKELSQDAILMIAANETKTPYPAANAYAALVAEANMPGTTLYRAGNTLFIMHHAKGRIGVFRALNADTPRNYLENSYEWVQAAYKMGFDLMVTEFKDPTILNIFKAISRKPPKPNMGYKAEQLRNGSYRVTLQLGPLRDEVPS